MTQENAARFFKAVRKDRALNEKLKATTEPETFVKIAKEQGYNLTIAELDTAINKLSEEEFASVINPGIGPRLHLIPR